MIRFLLQLLLLLGLSILCAYSQERKWRSLVDNAPEGKRPTLEITESSETSTRVKLNVFGFWEVSVLVDGKPHSVIEFPEPKLSGIGFPKNEGDRGWYDFPAESNYPLLGGERFARSCRIVNPVASVPDEEFYTGKNGSTLAEWVSAGADPSGARPGIPHLQAYLSVNKSSSSEDLGVDLVSDSTIDVELTSPIAPAGYTDIENPDNLPSAPDFIDTNFYDSLKEPFDGNVERVSGVSGAGVFSVVSTKYPMLSALSPSVVRVPTERILLYKHLAGPTDVDCELSWDAWIFQMPYLNGPALRESMTAKGGRILASRSARYLILTPREFHGGLMDFAYMKQAKGLQVDFAYVGNLEEDDVAPNRSAIDAYLEAYFRANYCHGVYVLLVGDLSIIPSGRSNNIRARPDRTNADSDHVYEVLGDDLFPSLYVGRLDVGDRVALKTQIDKIMKMEAAPPFGDWPLQVTLAANSENDDRSRGVSSSFPSKYAQAINAVANYDAYRVSPNFNVLHAGASTTQQTLATNADVISAINTGIGHLMYRGHGLEDQWVGGWDGSSTNGTSFSASAHVNGLQNEIYPIVYAIACRNSRLRSSGYIGGAWLAEPNGGACAHWGASVNSYTAENHWRARGVFRSLFESGFNRLGPALGEAERISFAESSARDWGNNTFCYVLNGCPETTIRFSPVYGLSPSTVNVSYPEEGMLFDVINPLTSRGVSAALIQIRLRDGRVLNGFTDSSGRLLMNNIDKDDEVLGYDISGTDMVPYSETLSALPQPSLRWADQTAINGREMVLEGFPGTYLVEFSEDLVTWQVYGRVVVGASGQESMMITIPEGHEFAGKYLRATREP